MTAQVVRIGRFHFRMVWRHWHVLLVRDRVVGWAQLGPLFVAWEPRP